MAWMLAICSGNDPIYMWPSSQYVCTQVNTFHDGCRLNKWNTKLVSVNCTTICNFNFKVAQPEFIWPPKLPPLATIWQLRRECKTLHIHTHENNWQGSTLVWHKYICTKWMFETYNPKPWMVDPNCNWDDILVMVHVLEIINVRRETLICTMSPKLLSMMTSNCTPSDEIASHSRHVGRCWGYLSLSHRYDAT